MGGKHNQAQRTKNNARPSSSCRSAELLGSTIPQFVGFSAVKESGMVLPGLSLDDIDSSLDSNFQLVLKKMYKKDSTTKLKALQEFTELTKAAESEAIKAVLPFWPRLYCTLATDTDHKVREATHVAHQQVVLKAKRNLAPYLKQLAGAWFTSQYDTYAPASSAATKSFQDAFPQNKIPEAIIFCQEEILSYICENLTVHTVQTLSNSKNTTPEDAEAKHQRVLISSLQGYALYLQKVPTDEIEKQVELNTKILSNSKFWKLGKHKVAPIRSSWFNVITTVCQKSPLFREKESAHIVGAVFSNLDETEPVVLSSVWEAVLSVLSFMNDWWQYVNIEKLFLPKLWKVLKEGGQGNASIICPNLLPVISHLPPLTDINTIYCTFFENMRIGMKQRNIASRSESVAISTAFIECLQYIILKNQSDVGLCERLIKTQLFPVLEWGLTDNQASYKSLFNQVTKLIQYWSRNENNSSYSNYPRYLSYFWHNLSSLFQGLLLNLEYTYEANVLSQLSNRQIELLLSLKHSTKPKSQLKVSFSNEKLNENDETRNENILTNDLHKSYLNSLNDLSYETCQMYVKLVNEKNAKELIDHLVCLIQDFDSKNFFHHLNVEFKRDDLKSNLVEVYNRLLVKWLFNEELCSKAVVDLVFLLFKYLQPEEKIHILKSYSSVPTEDCFGWCLARSLSHPHNSDPVIEDWLRGEKVSEFLVKIVEKEINDTCTPELSLILKQAFMEKSNGDLYISKEAVSSIVEILNKTLLNPSEYSVTVDSCASFAAFISTVIYTSNFKLTYGEHLLLAMFNLSCFSNIDSSILSKDTLWEVNTAWQDVISTLSQELIFEEFKSLTSKCADIVEKEVFSHSISFDDEHIVDVIVNFMKCLQTNNPLWMSDVLNIFLQRNLIPSLVNILNKVCICAEYIRGDLCSPHQVIENVEFFEDNLDIVKYMVWMDLIAHVLTSSSGTAEEEEDDMNETNNSLVIESLPFDANVTNVMIDLVYSLSLANSFKKHYNCIKYYHIVNAKFKSIKEKLKVLIFLNEDSLNNFEETLIERLHEKDLLWFKAFYIFSNDILLRDLEVTCTKIITGLKTITSNLTHMYLIRVFSDYFTYDNVSDKLSPIESVVVLRYLINSEELDVPIAEAFSRIDHIQQENRPKFLYENITDISWSETEKIIECARFYSVILKNKSQCVQANRWDPIVLSVAAWFKNIAKYKNKYNTIQMKSFIVALSDLFVSVTEYINSCNKEDIKNEWRDIFSQELHKNIIEIWLYISEQYQETSKSISITDLPLLQEFCKIVHCLDYSFIFKKAHLNLPKWSKLYKESCRLLVHQNNTLQLWGYNMLKLLLPGLVELDSVSVDTNTPHEKGLIIEQFKTILCSTQEVVQSMLIDFRLGEDSCRVEPFTDSYTYTYAYFLVWDILLMLCECSLTELRYQYADWLRNYEFLNILLNNIFKLMPVEILQYGEGQTKRFSQLFTTKFSTSPMDTFSSERIEHMVCWIYSFALSQLPAIVRQWWSSRETRTAQIVEKVTATFVSPQLCNQELAAVAQHENKFKNMVIKVYPSVREVIAIYTVDEAQMELVITLPANYPLGGPDVQCNRQICGTSHRQWLMQLKMCVLHQNGRIWDGLSLWNSNLDKKFDGVEECYICFAVLHQGTYQLPKLSCQTCKKKFHSACLYKWFSTSNKSTCPICRNLF